MKSFGSDNTLLPGVGIFGFARFEETWLEWDCGAVTSRGSALLDADDAASDAAAGATFGRLGRVVLHVVDDDRATDHAEPPLQRGVRNGGFHVRLAVGV